jgi:predicted permease
MALRLAIGARRSQIVRQLLTEGVVVALVGGAAGVLLAQWMVSLLVPLVPAGLLPAHVVVGLDGRVLGFSLGITLLCGIVCGLAPALLSGRKDLGETLREGSRASSSGLGRIRRPGLQQVLVAGEVAVALVLLVGAGLMIRSLRERLAVTPGFAVERVTAARIALPRQRYEPEQRNAFANRLVDRLREIPMVAAASISSDLPMRGMSNATVIQPDPGGEWIRVYRHVVTPDFFEVLQIPILKGRGFTADDRAGTPLVAVISDAMARRFWPGQDPIGKRFQYNRDGVEVTIVGVAGNARYRDVTTDLSTTEPDVFYPFAQRTDASIEVAIRSRSGGLPPIAEVRRAVASLDPSLPLYDVFPLETGLQSQFAASRFASLVLGAFSVVALVLAAIGIYGVISFVVGLARREIAIRMALGADRQRVLGVVVRNGMTLVLIGAGVGVLSALAATRALSSLLYGVDASDPLTFAVVTTALVSVALFASWLPARRAAAVEPQSVLKEE